MPSSYPGSLDELNGGVGTSGQALSSPDHPTHHTALADAVEAVQGELGTDPSGGAATVKARLDALDTTVSGKVAAALVDAKGDLLAATAADTVARLAVGTNGHVLTADSAEATGIKWAAASGSGDPTMGGDLSGLASNAQIVAGAVGTTELAADAVTSAKIAAGTIVDSDVAAANKDGTAGTASLRTLGTGSQQAAAGDHTHSGVYEPADADLTAVAGLATTGLVERTGSGTAATRTIGVAAGTDIPSTSDADGRYVAKSLVDAKGDLLTATADNTPARLGVGTNGHVLTADSSQSTGVKWAAASGITWNTGQVPISGHYYPTDCNSIAGSKLQINADVIWYTPFWFMFDGALDRICLILDVVGTAGAGSSTGNLGIYSTASNGYQPGSRLIDAGTLDLTATTGWREITISQAFTAGTLYWAAVTHGLAGTLPTLSAGAASGYAPSLFGSMDATSALNTYGTTTYTRQSYGWKETRTYDGTLPSTAGTLTTARHYSGNTPLAIVRAA